jgi:hypothetical protein
MTPLNCVLCAYSGIDVRRIDVARHRGEQIDVFFGERAAQVGGISDLHFVEGVVFDHVHDQFPFTCSLRRGDIEAASPAGLRASHERPALHEARAPMKKGAPHAEAPLFTGYSPVFHRTPRIRPARDRRSSPA